MLSHSSPGYLLSGPGAVHVRLLLHELHWLAVCVQLQFKVLLITFKSLHGMGPSYSRNHLTPLGLAPPSVSAEKACCRCCHSSNYGWRCPDEAHSLPWLLLFGTICPSLRLAPILPTFCKDQKTCQMALHPNGEQHTGDG